MSNGSSKRHPTYYLSYAERAALPGTSLLAADIFSIVEKKRTNLCLSADVTSTSELLKLAEQVGDHICVLKTHIDIIRDFSSRTVRCLREIARRKNFIVFEDRKFGDIGSKFWCFFFLFVNWMASLACIEHD